MKMCFLVAFRHVKRHSNVIMSIALLLLVLSGSTEADDHPAVSSKKVDLSQSLGSSSRSGSAAADEIVSKSMSHQSSSSVPDISASPVKAKLNDTTKSTEDHSILNASSSNSSAGQAHSIVNTPEDADGEFAKKLNPEALMRAFYVFVGLSVIVMVYFAWKSFGKRPTQVHRYGVVANREDLEMAPLDSDDGEEDDTTHFDISKHRLQ